MLDEEKRLHLTLSLLRPNVMLIRNIGSAAEIRLRWSREDAVRALFPRLIDILIDQLIDACYFVLGDLSDFVVGQMIQMLLRI